MKLYFLIVIVHLNLNIHISSGQVNNLPNIPCPDIFQYSFDGIWKAEITLPTPNVYDVSLSVNLTVPENQLQDDGHLSLNNKNIIDDIKNNRPFVYTYILPKSKNLPHLTLITYNGNIVCIGPEISSSPNYKFSLSHKINWYSPDIKLPQRSTNTPPSRENKPLQPQNDNNCGLVRNRRQINNDSEIVQLIYSGKSISRSSHPWLAALYDSAAGSLVFFCGGNLISNKHVLSAAHCMENRQNVEVKVGAHNTKDFFENGAIIRAVSRFINHEEYRQGSGHADLSILILVETVEFTDFVKPICLWNTDTNIKQIIGERGTIMGWGLTEQGNVSSSPLQTDVTIISQEQCQSINILKSTLSSSTFCAGTKGAGPCLGDSGGGLLLRRQGKWYIRGIISITSGNRRLNICDVNTYAVYADTAKHMTWIIENMK